MISATARYRREIKVPHPTALAAFLLILVFCLIIRARIFYYSSPSAEPWQHRHGSFFPTPSFRDVLHEGIKSIHVRSKSQHPSYTHTSSVGNEATVEDMGESITIRTRLPNRPKSVRSIKDVQAAVIDGGSAITIQIHAPHYAAGGRKKVQFSSTVGIPHWTYDHYVPLGQGIKIERSGIKMSLSTDGELTIVARKLGIGENKGNSNVKLMDL